MFMYEIAKNKFILIDKFEFISQVHNHAERKICRQRKLKYSRRNPWYYLDKILFL